jgi:hypothetical protein
MNLIDKVLTLIIKVLGLDKSDAEREQDKAVELHDATRDAQKTGDTSRLERWIRKMRG